MYSNGITLNPSSYKNLFSSASGILNVPVKPSAVIYSQLDYVHGVSAGRGENGVPINRIRILNTLINQLVSMKKESSVQKDFGGLSEEQKDSLIKSYQQQIQNEVARVQSQPASYALAGLMPETGSVISVMA